MWSDLKYNTFENIVNEIHLTPVGRFWPLNKYEVAIRPPAPYKMY